MEVEPNDLVYYFIVLLLLFFVSVGYLLVHSGLLSPIVIDTRRPSFGSLHVAYKFARGAYKNAGHLFTEAHSLVPELRTIGVSVVDPISSICFITWCSHGCCNQLTNLKTIDILLKGCFFSFYFSGVLWWPTASKCPPANLFSIASLFQVNA